MECDTIRLKSKNIGGTFRVNIKMPRGFILRVRAAKILLRLCALIYPLKMEISTTHEN
jgi:hypothetical protein